MIHASHAPRTYTQIKTKLKRNTAAIGSVMSAYYATESPESGVSALIGAASAYAYVALLTKKVDTIDTNKGVLFQAHVALPTAVAAFEKVMPYDFDMGVTFVTFLSYQMALMTFIYDIIRDMVDEEE
jgi:hypothetical protein